MSSLNTILVATDLSKSSGTAVARGLTLADEHQLECTILHVIPKDMVFEIQSLFGSSKLAFESDAIKQQTQALNSSVKELLEERRVDVRTRLRIGKPSHEIAEQAREDKADLIVVSYSGQGVVKRLVLGSTTLGVLQESPCPVLVVKSAESQLYRNVLLAIDFSDMSDAVMQTAQRYAPDAQFVLTHVLEGSLDDMQRLALVHQEQIEPLRQTAIEQMEQKLHELAQASGLRQDQYQVEVLTESSGDSLLAAQRRLECDLIVTGKHGHHATRDRLLGSFTQSILTHTDCDVLVAQSR